MNVMEYLKCIDSTGSVLSETDGRLTIRFPETGDAPNPARGDCVEIEDVLEDLMEGVDYDAGRAWLDPESTSLLRRTELRIDPGMERYDSGVRRPYYRLRGRPVTPEQARDVIRRTDGFIGHDLLFTAGFDRLPEEALLRRDFVGSTNFNQWWFSRNHFPTHYGWSHPDGIIGTDAITQKYPNFREYLGELLLWKRTFPYLDLCIAVSGWDEQPPERRRAASRADRELYDAEKVPDARFVRELEIGICTHGSVIEFLNPENAAARYLDYAARFPAPEAGRFDPEFYERKGLLICGEEYLLRCLADYGLDRERALEMLAMQGEYTWRDSRFPGASD